MIHRANDDEEEEYRKISAERESGRWKLSRYAREGRFGVFGARLRGSAPDAVPRYGIELPAPGARGGI